jgi:hypothetical protein
MNRFRLAPLVQLPLLLLVALVLAPAAHAALAEPTVIAPAEDAVLDSLPAFAWAPVAGAHHYEFEISADAGFDSPVLGFGYDQFPTNNTRATLRKTIPNGTYWWHVRGITTTGEVGPWSAPHAFTKAWTTQPIPLSPTDGAWVVHPTVPMRLRWSPVPNAREYLVSVSAHPSMASLVGGKEVKTEATTLTLDALLASGPYYWRVTPLDAAGNRGAPSSIASFTWIWQSQTTPEVTDMDVHEDVFDPLFSWDPVAGAVKYEVEVYSASGARDYSEASKVCCTDAPVMNALAPKLVLKDNSYYWRVRALDAAGHTGVWNDGPDFTKTFGTHSVPNLHMRDHVTDPGTDVAPELDGYQTEVPIVAWDPVSGASSYNVDVVPHQNGSCNWTAPEFAGAWRVKTAATAWTPLGKGWNGKAPYGSTSAVAADAFAALTPNQAYCVRVRPRDGDSTSGRIPEQNYVPGNYTYLNGSNEPAFVWMGFPAGGDCSPSCTSGYLGSDDYLEPQRGTIVGRMPLFTWNPIAGKQSYFVIVAKDPDFHTIVDYAFTQLPAYAPRGSFDAITYADETTSYYWAVLPASSANGSGAVGDPLSAAPSSFVKLSTPPTPLDPVAGERSDGRAVFQWSPVEDARRYRLEIATEPTFGDCRSGFAWGTCLEIAVTDSTAYASSTTYPADTQVYWRVRGEDEWLKAMTWSETSSFVSRLRAPVTLTPDPASGDFLPTGDFEPVPGAVSYDIEFDQPNGQHVTFPNWDPASFTPHLVWGTGIWKWRVRASFPQAGQVAKGPFSPFVSFTREIRQPAGAETEVGPDPRVVLSWLPKTTGPGNGIKQYKVEFATRPDFSDRFLGEFTENTVYAPTLTHFAFARGGTFYWRVAAMDGSNVNLGDFTAPQSFTLAAGATSRAPTRITAFVSRKGTKIKVRGAVSPPRPGKRIVVTLYRKRAGVFGTIAAKRPKLSTMSAYAASFARPGRGTCKVTARYPGDAAYAPAAVSRTFRC